MQHRHLLTSAMFAGLSMLTTPLIGCGDSGGAGDDIPGPPITPVSNPEFDPNAPVDAAVQSNNALAVAMYKQLAEPDQQADNLFFSPTSIAAALMLTYEGSRNQTQAEFEKVLSLKGDDRLAAHKAYAGMLGRLTGEGKPYELSVANALWGEQTMPFRDAFLETVRAHYAASFESVDFKRDFENQRKRINGWVEKRTHDRIKDLLPDGSLDDLTRLVLVNAIYFKAPWAIDFDEGATQPQPFYVMSQKPGDDRATVQVPMMRQFMEHYRYADMDGFNALTMVYKGGDLSMLVLLPDDKAGLPALETKLSAELIAKTVSAMKGEVVNLWLPKWETTQDYDLVPALKALGMKGAFAARTADFTGLSDSAEAEDLYISGVFHKAFIAVDEEGTEAAAATAVVVLAESAAIAEEPIDFRCDHPFIYLIRDNRTGAVLFMGRVTDPS